MNLHRLFWGLYLVVITPMTLIGGFSFGWIWGWLPALPAAGMWVGVMAVFVIIVRMDALLEQLENSEEAARLLSTRIEGTEDQFIIRVMTTVDEQLSLRYAEEQWGLGRQLRRLHEQLLGETIIRVELVDRWASGGYFNVRAPVLTIVTESGKVVELLPYLPMSTAPWVVTPEQTRPVQLVETR